MDESVANELEDLIFSDNEDNVTVILNNKARDGRKDSFCETPTPSECHLDVANTQYQNECQKSKLPTNSDLLNQSYENQNSFPKPMEKPKADGSAIQQSGNCLLERLSPLPEEMLKNAEVESDHQVQEIRMIGQELGKFTLESTKSPVTESVPDSAQAFGSTHATQLYTNQQSALKPGKQLRPDAPIFMPTFLSTLPVQSSADTLPSAFVTPSVPVLEPSAEINAEIAEEGALLGVVTEPVSDSHDHSHAEVPNVLNSTPIAPFSTDDRSLKDEVPHIEQQKSPEHSLCNNSMPKCPEKISPETTQDVKKRDKETNAWFDLKIKQLVASNYMYQCQMDALKEDQRRLLLLLSNAKASKSKKHKSDMLVEEISKCQCEVRSLKMEKEKLERKLRTFAKQSPSSIDTKSQISELLTSQRQSVLCQTVPNFEPEKKLLTSEFAYLEQQINELRDFAGKLFSHNALPSAERCSVAADVTELESKLAQNLKQLKKYISRLSELRSVNDMTCFKCPHPHLGAEISSLRCKIFDKMLHSLNGATSSQKVDNEALDGSGSGSSSESESDEEPANRVAFRVPIKKPPLKAHSVAQDPEPVAVPVKEQNQAALERHESTNQPPMSSVAAEGDVSSSLSCKKISPGTRSNSSMASGSCSNSATGNEKSESSLEKSTEEHGDLPKTNPQNPHKIERVPENPTTTNANANSSKKTADNIVAILQKVFPGKNDTELRELIKLSGPYLSKEGYNMKEITVEMVVKGAKHVGMQLGYRPAC